MPKRFVKRKRTFKKKRSFRKKRMVKSRKYKQDFSLKCEQRCDMRGKAYANGSEGVRAAIYWGQAGNNATNFPDTDHIFSPFKTDEWNFWHTKFEEYQVVGVKISAYPGIASGQAAGNNFHVLQSMAMGTTVIEIADADNVTTNVLYPMNDFGKHTPDPSKPMHRYYGIAKSERKKFQPIWLSTRGPTGDGTNFLFSKTVTYYNWEINDIDDNPSADTQIVGKLYATYFIKFRRPRADNLTPS